MSIGKTARMCEIRTCYFYGGVLFTQIENIKRGRFILDKTKCNPNIDLDPFL